MNKELDPADMPYFNNYLLKHRYTSTQSVNCMGGYSYIRAVPDDFF
jgi:hypothetical protein